MRVPEEPPPQLTRSTVRGTSPLVDTTGNNRWWTIAVTHINYEHGIDM